MAIDKPYKIGNLAYTLARQLLVKDKGGIASLPNPKEILTKVQDIFDMLKAGGYNPVSAEKSIKNVNDLKKVLTDVDMKLTIDKNLRSSQSEGIEEVMKKMDRGIPLNPGDQAKMEGIETVADDKVLDAFKGFKPKVIQGGKGAETEAEMIARMNKQNKDSVARLKQKKEKDLGDKLKDYDGDPDAMAIGGRAGFGKGDIVTKGIPFAIKELKKRFGKKAITTADKIDRPAKAKLNKEFKDFEERIGNRRLTEDELDELYGEFDEAVPYPMETVADKNKFLKSVKDEQDYMFQQYKAGRLDPKPGEEGRKRFLQKKMEEMEMSGDKKLMTQDEIDELISFDQKERLFNAQGGRIGFSGGGAGFAGNQMEGSQPGGQMDMPRNLGFQPIVPMPQTNIPGSGGMSEFKQFLQATGTPELGMGYNFPVGQSGVLGLSAAPSGNVGMQFKMPLSGGRFGFKDGSKPPNPGRRNFMKMMAGLASLPVVGKLFKPAAKVAEAGPAIAEGVKLGFDKFVMLVNKIKSLGKKTNKVTQKEREVGYTYEGKDGSQYELVEDLATGDVRVTKDKPGFAMSGDEAYDTIEDRSTFYLKRNQADETTKGRKPPDEYDEVKEVPSRDGTFDDIDEVNDNTVKEILEELSETKTKKASGGLAYMLGE